MFWVAQTREVHFEFSFSLHVGPLSFDASIFCGINYFEL